jgi:GGDEF domain-containing protein
MSQQEFFIWSAMTGAISLMAIFALADIVRTRLVAAWRGLAFVLLTGGGAVLMTGLPEFVFQLADSRVLLAAKATVGPLSGAASLLYLVHWLGIKAGERIHTMVMLIAVLIVAAALVVLLVHLMTSGLAPATLIGYAAAINCVPILLGLAISLRSALLGDPLAWWMTAACILLVCFATGLYAHGLGLDIGLIGIVLTAVCTLLYFVSVSVLMQMRNATHKQLKNLLRTDTSKSLVTGLPIGSALIEKVDDAIWRNARFGYDCAALGICLQNLYELNDRGGRDVEIEIHTRTIARLRRAVGFKDVVGHMDARYIVVLVSGVKDTAAVEQLAQSIFHVLQRPMRVGAFLAESYMHVPEISIGITHVATRGLQEINVLTLIDQAQALAQKAASAQGRLLVQTYSSAIAPDVQSQSEIEAA